MPRATDAGGRALAAASVRASVSNPMVIRLSAGPPTAPAGAPPGTGNVPMPCRRSTSPSATSMPSARRTVARDTASISASDGSLGNGVVGSNTPSRII